MNKEELKSNYAALGFGLVAATACFAIAGGIVFGSMYLARPYENLRTSATRATNQYLTSQQTALLAFVTEYQALEAKRLEAHGDRQLQDAYAAQQKAILEQMRETASTLPADEVPVSVRALIDP